MTEPTPGTTGAEGAADPSKGEPTPEAGDEKVTLTKAELDAKMAEVRRGVESSVSKKFSDYDDLKNKASEFDKIAEANKSELQKTQESLSTKDEEISSLRNELQSERAQAAVSRVATKMKFVNPGLAYRLVDLKALEYDDGKPVEKSIEDALKPLVESDPYLVSSKPRGDGGGGPRGGDASGQSMNDRLRNAVRGS